MDFEQSKKLPKNINNYHIENLTIAREFSKNLLLEMNNLVKSIVIFGSTSINKQKKESDIDILVILDNVSVIVSEELRESYKIITSQLSEDLGKGKLHLQTMNLSDFFNMSQKYDPILINILRTGTALFDKDLFEPIQYLLEIGKIKPTLESIFNYQSRAQVLFEDTNKHIENALLDLYYSTIDILHSTLMIKKITSPSPKDMPKIFERIFKKDKKMLEHLPIIKNVYTISKEIEHRKISFKLDGKFFDKTKKEVNKLLKDLLKYNQDEMDKKDLFYY